jgi:hypothetical protein
MTHQFHFMPDEFHFMAELTTADGARRNSLLCSEELRGYRSRLLIDGYVRAVFVRLWWRLRFRVSGWQNSGAACAE